MLIIGLCLTMIVGLQSCAIAVGGRMAADKATSGGGAVGVLVAFLFILGSAFALGLPRLSAGIFLLAGVLGLITGSTTVFKDMNIWGGIALILSVMAYLGSRELRRKKEVSQVAAR
ncbi:hypothetical protein J2X36_003968 [Methylobacterium sp. BE186]|uniref:hypothetical protein n=1 Tax=Methylobacterium sp. BE186 TaxID=2817715 RepID=UPI00285CBA0C|nr:hypothetical protein [Methylobacterium sp. BE186]MDR7039195.1 hypothetical protein [Methylobacterium sp. BE186]